MSWLNNFKIIYKISLIVGLLAMVMVGVVSFAVSKMRTMDDANTEMVTVVDKYTSMTVRAGRRAEAYVAAAFQLAAETTDAGNAKFLAATAESRKGYESIMAESLK